MKDLRIAPHITQSFSLYSIFLCKRVKILFMITSIFQTRLLSEDHVPVI